jgi:uncharacterized protein (TIGR02246 family)
MVARMLAAVILTTPAMASAGQARACSEARSSDIAEVMRGWQAAVANGDIETVTGYYIADAVLLPALGDGPLMGRAAIRDYFTMFGSRHPMPKITMQSVMSGCGMATEVGTATYQITGHRKGTRMLIGGRYTTVLVERDGRWLIAQQSLSLMPQPNRRLPLQSN